MSEKITGYKNVILVEDYLIIVAEKVKEYLTLNGIEYKLKRDKEYYYFYVNGNKDLISQKLIDFSEALKGVFTIEIL